MTDAVVRHAEASIAKGSTSFGFAARLFAPAMRQDVWQLYAWCRRCDDEIDGQDHGHGRAALSRAARLERLAKVRRLTEAALAGEPLTDPDFLALQQVAARRRLDPAWARELIDGFALDAAGAEFPTEADTLDYCWKVAGVVGVMMASLMGAHDPAVLRRAQDLGLAFQLTNICRDVGEDARSGRIYLAGERLREAGLDADPGRLLEPGQAERVFGVVSGHLQLAEAYYASARQGLRALPFRAALAIAAAREIYRGIGRRILKAGPPALARRMAVPKPVMAALLARAIGVALVSRLEALVPPAPRPPLWSRI